MKNVIIGSVIGAGLALSGWPAGAQDRTPGVDQRQQNQMGRIEQGVQSGELTKPETRGLLREQRHIRRQERRAKRDGVVTPQERRRLHRSENRSSRHIYEQKHDGQQRGEVPAAPAPVEGGQK